MLDFSAGRPEAVSVGVFCWAWGGLVCLRGAWRGVRVKRCPSTIPPPPIKTICNSSALSRSAPQQPPCWSFPTLAKPPQGWVALVGVHSAPPEEGAVCRCWHDLCFSFSFSYLVVFFLFWQSCTEEFTVHQFIQVSVAIFALHVPFLYVPVVCYHYKYGCWWKKQRRKNDIH